MKTIAAAMSYLFYICREKQKLFMQKTDRDYTIGTTDLTEYIGSVIRPADGMILYCERGRAVVTVNFERRVLRRGDIAIIFSDSLFEVNSVSRGFLVWYIDMSVAFVDDATFALSSDFFDRIYIDPVFSTSDKQRKLFDAWRSLNDYYMRIPSKKSAQTMIRNQVRNLLSAMESETMSDIAAKRVKTISSARQLSMRFYRLLDENCRSRHDVKFYADKLCITPYYLSKITLQTMGISPKKMIDRQIVMEIKRMLLATDLSAKEIADRFHFDSTSYMGRYFRRHTGMTPTEFREQ